MPTLEEKKEAARAEGSGSGAQGLLPLISVGTSPGPRLGFDNGCYKAQSSNSISDSPDEEPRAEGCFIDWVVLPPWVTAPTKVQVSLALTPLPAPSFVTSSLRQLLRAQGWLLLTTRDVPSRRGICSLLKQKVGNSC